MKSILFHVNFFLAGGIEKVLLALLQSLDANKYNIHLSITYKLGSAEILKPQLPAHVKVHYLLENPLLIAAQKKKRTGNITVFQKIVSELFLARLIKREKKRNLRKTLSGIDVVIDFDMTLASMQNLFAHKKNIAYCHFSLAHYSHGNKRKLKKLARRLSLYDKVIMLCDEMKDDAIQLFPFLKPKLVRLYNALDFEQVYSKAAEPIEDFSSSFLVSVGRLQESQKDFTTLIKAYAICVKEHSLAENLLIVGDGGSRKDLERLAAELDVSDKVIFTGFQSNPYKYISKSKLFLFSSKYEGLPTVIIEALALSKPIIATACPTGVRELLMYGKAGTLVEVGNEQAFANAIVTLLHNEALQEQYVANAHNFLSQFNIKHVVKEFEKLIN